MALALCLGTVLVAASSALAACPNEALRIRQQATELPDCRAYEQVSPVAKKAGVQASYIARALPSGDAVEFQAPGGTFGGAQAAPAFAQFIARRQASAWSTTATTPPQAPKVGGSIFSTTFWPSSDLTKVVGFSRLALAPGAADGNGNVYVRDLRDGGYDLKLTTANQLFDPLTLGTISGQFVGASSDLETGMVMTAVPLTPDGVEGVTSLYAWAGDEVHLVKREPAAETVSPGSGSVAN